MRIESPFSELLQPRSLENSKPPQAERANFGNLLRQALGEVNQLQFAADQASMQLALGQVDDLHHVTIATEKAHLALQLTVAIRNKVVEAYQEVSRMQV